MINRCKTQTNFCLVFPNLLLMNADESAQNYTREQLRSDINQINIPLVFRCSLNFPVTGDKKRGALSQRDVFAFAYTVHSIINPMISAFEELLRQSTQTSCIIEPQQWQRPHFFCFCECAHVYITILTWTVTTKGDNEFWPIKLFSKTLSSPMKKKLFWVDYYTSSLTDYLTAFRFEGLCISDYLEKYTFSDCGHLSLSPVLYLSVITSGFH